MTGSLGEDSGCILGIRGVLYSVPGRRRLQIKMSLLAHWEANEPWSSFPCLLGKPQGTTTKTRIFFYPCRTPKNPWARREERTKKKRNSLGKKLSGTGDSQRDSRKAIRANHSQLTPLFLQRVRPIRTNHSNFRFARITPLRKEKKSKEIQRKQ